jgi:hypothetical protein
MEDKTKAISIILFMIRLATTVIHLRGNNPIHLTAASWNTLRYKKKTSYNQTKTGRRM